MSKNIFSVLQTKNDSDDESKTHKNAQPDHHPTKKEQRADDQVKREHFGDKVVKDEHQGQKIKDGPKNKGDYQSGEKRPYERHSGTGRPAFTHDYKKGGHGKGNVGGEKDIKEDLNKDNQKEEDQKKEVPAPEPKEEIITLDEFVAQSGFNTEFLKKVEEIKIGNVNITDKNLKVIKPIEKVTETYNKKNVKHTEDFVHSNANKLISGIPIPMAKTKSSNNKDNGKKNSKIEFNDSNFPSL